MKRILVAFDGTPGAELAVRDLVCGGFPDRCEARVLAIADVWMPPAPLTGDLLAEYPSVARAHERAAEVLRAAGRIAVQGAQMVHDLLPQWTVSNCGKADSPAWGILAEAKSWNADLIVIGSHGRTILEKFFLGSVSFKVAAEAACSVRVVRPRHGPRNSPMRLLVALDGSEASRVAADEVIGRKWGSGTQIELVTVIDEALKARVAAQNGFGDRNSENGVQSILDTTRDRFVDREVLTASHILEGDPKTALLEQSAKWNIDTIFIGARGFEHGDRLYLGTLASAICSRAHCSVEIVRPRPH